MKRNVKLIFALKSVLISSVLTFVLVTSNLSFIDLSAMTERPKLVFNRGREFLVLTDGIDTG